MCETFASRSHYSDLPSIARGPARSPCHNNAWRAVLGRFEMGDEALVSGIECPTAYLLPLGKYVHAIE